MRSANTQFVMFVVARGFSLALNAALNGLESRNTRVKIRYSLSQKMSDNASTSKKELKKGICPVCKSAAKLCCARCKITYYCNREHQKSDWKVHSKDCRIYDLAENSTIGRHYVAARDINVDEIVISESKPLLAALNLGSPPVCVSCYAPLTLGNVRSCYKCGWSLCRDCTRHGPECELTIKYRKSKVQLDKYTLPTSMYNAIMVLRAIEMRNKNPKDYKKFLNLQDHCDEMFNDSITGLMPFSNTDVPAYNVKSYMKIDDLDVTEIARIMGIMRVNAFKNVTPKEHHCSVVFEKASYLAHDCRPNCRYSVYYDIENAARMVIRAVRVIPKGQPITIGYTNCMQDTVQRRRFLRVGKCFDCTCERCKDPTDFGTMFSAVKCFQEECTGYMLPPTFLVPFDEKVPDFVCTRCKLTTSSATIDEMMEQISTKFAKIDKSNEEQLRRFIDNQSKFLHTNHFHIINAELDLIRAVNMKTSCDEKSLSVNKLKENIKLCKKLNSLHEILEPASTATRGSILILQYQQTTLLQNAIQPQRHQFHQFFTESKNLLVEAYRLMRYEPKETDGGRLAELAREKLDAMNDMGKLF